MRNKITRKNFLKILAATAVGGASASLLAGAAAPAPIDESNGRLSRWAKNTLDPDGALDFAAQYNADGGDCTVVDLPKIGITGNSHFMFQETNNKQIADHIYNWLESRGLA